FPLEIRRLAPAPPACPRRNLQSFRGPAAPRTVSTSSAAFPQTSSSSPSQQTSCRQSAPSVARHPLAIRDQWFCVRSVSGPHSARKSPQSSYLSLLARPPKLWACISTASPRLALTAPATDARKSLPIAPPNRPLR